MFAAAALRIMPSLSRLMISTMSIKEGLTQVDLVYAGYEDLQAKEAKAVSVAAEVPPLKLARAIEVEHVSYAYGGKGAFSLHDVSFTVPAGSSLALVGPSGSGKTTLVDLVLGLLAPGAGRILVDGVDITGKPSVWQNKVGYIPQNIFLLDDNIRRNVAFGVADDKISDEQVLKALRAAQLEDFVAALPAGLDTQVGERGVRMSGGQRQRLGIARALYGDPALIVMDEATSALDSATEREVTRAVEALIGVKTLIIIAHRMSTVRRCNQILFVRDGVILDRGTFEQLERSNAEFARFSAG
jgi:ATP-binding cassette subfamily C protein